MDKTLCIRYEHFNIAFMTLKQLNIHQFNIMYRSPSAFLNGIYLHLDLDAITFIAPLEIEIKNSNLCVILSDLDTEFAQRVRGYVSFRLTETVNDVTDKIVCITMRITRKIEKNTLQGKSYIAIKTIISPTDDMTGRRIYYPVVEIIIGANKTPPIS